MAPPFPRRVLVENIFSLAVLQGVNYVAPLITLPYLARVLRPAHFGLLAYAQSIILYFDLFTDFGFNFSASRAIARNRQEGSEIGRVFWSTLGSKVLLMSVSGIGLAALMEWVPGLRQLRALLAANFLYIIGTAFFPVWYFQGVEQLKLAATCAGVARLLTVPALILLVRSPGDYVCAGAIQASVELTATVLALPYLFRRAQIGWYRPTVNDILRSLREGWPLFLSVSALQISSSSTIVILARGSGLLQVGYFSAADKIARTATAILNPIGLALYPRISAVKLLSPAAALRLIRKSMFAMAGIGSLASVVTFLGAHPFCRAILGHSYDHSALVLQILSPLPLLYALMSVFGAQTMLVFGMDGVFSRLMIGSVAVALPTTLLFTHFLGAAGAAIGTDIVSSGIVAGMAMILSSRGLPVWQRAGVEQMATSEEGRLPSETVHGNTQ